jgi:hypothetical protein
MVQPDDLRHPQITQARPWPPGGAGAIWRSGAEPYKALMAFHRYGGILTSGTRTSGMAPITRVDDDVAPMMTGVIPHPL